MFMLVGPNTGVGNTSMIYMIESQLRYLLDALRRMERYELATVEPTLRCPAAVQHRLAAQDGPHRLDDRLRELVSGCPRS